MKIEIKILSKEFYSVNGLPKYATPGSAAVDLVATQDYTIYPGEVVEIQTGLAMWIGSSADEWRRNGKDPKMETYTHLWDYAGLILPRSGLGTKGLVLANTIGLIDEDYQKEIIVKAWNKGQSDE